MTNQPTAKTPVHIEVDGKEYLFNLTDLEVKMLRNIAENHFHSGGVGEARSYVWSDCLDEGPFTLGSRQHGGLVASLSKKELVQLNGLAGRDACVALTDLGSAVWAKLPH